MFLRWVVQPTTSIFLSLFGIVGVLLQEELEKRKERGEDVGVMAQFSAMKSVMGRLQTEMKKDRWFFDESFGCVIVLIIDVPHSLWVVTHTLVVLY